MTDKTTLFNVEDDINTILDYLGLPSDYDTDERYENSRSVNSYHTWDGPSDGGYYTTKLEVVLDYDKNEYSCWATLCNDDGNEESSEGNSGNTLADFLKGVLNLIDGNWSAFEDLMDNEDAVRDLIENVLAEVNETAA